MNVTELHLHDHFSALDGLNSPHEYMVRAKELGMTHLAQTNHGTLSGHREFQAEAAKAGITPILGVEAYISPTDRFDKRSKAKREDGTAIYNHIILLAQNQTGLETLNRINQEAWESGFYNKPRIDEDLLFDDNAGLIVLSGCIGGLLAKAIERGDIGHAKRVAANFKANLGNRYFIEVQGHNPPEINKQLLEIADALNIKPVATSDCHYARKEDLWVEQAMLILATNPKIDRSADLSKAEKMDYLERFNYIYPDRMMTFEEYEIFLRDRGTHSELFSKQGIDRVDIYDNTMEIAESVGEYEFNQGLDLLPREDGIDPKTELRKMVIDGAKRRGTYGDPVYDARREEDLEIISGKNFDTYHIVTAKMVKKAKDKGIPVGPGRGSGAGCLVNYELGITDVDPIKYGLLTFRYINPERNDFPDIDIDFGDKYRGAVKEDLRMDYGNVASIQTRTTFAGKGAIRAAARALNIPKADVNRALKNNDSPSDEIYIEMFEASEQGRVFNSRHPAVVPLAKRLHGRISGTGMHPSGMVIANQAISNVAPMETAKDPNDKLGPRIPMVAMDMEEVADLGLIKFDILGLKAMTIIDETVKSIKSNKGITIDTLKIDLDDKKVYQMLSRGYTKGVFQCEAVPYTNLIIKMGGVQNFDELVASNALVRPGAMNTIGAEYIARKNGKSMIVYVHECMKPFTKDTYGEVLYQEQVMLTMTELAGMKMSTADKVRKIIGKKRDVKEFEQFKEEFLDGAEKKIKRKMAEKLWTDFEAHAGYSFNKSHAVAYSMVSFWTAWLKYYYPLEFMAATLAAETENKSQDAKDSITDYLIESKRLGLKILLPHVNASDKVISLEDNGIRLGLTNIKFIAEKGAEALMKNRPYDHYQHLYEVSQTKGSGVTSRILGALNAVGAASFEDHPKTGHERDNFYEYLNIPAFSQKSIDPIVRAKFRELDEYDEQGVFPILVMARGMKIGDTWARVEVVDETGTAGIFTSKDTQIQTGQMYAMLVANNSVFRYMTMDELNDKTPGGFTDYLYDQVLTPSEEGQYLVVANKPYRTKRGAKMMYLVLQDHLGQLIYAMVFPQQYGAVYMKCREGRVIKADLAETDSGSLYVKEIS